MGIGRGLRRGAELFLGLWEELEHGVEISSLGIGRSLRRGAELFLGLWEELKDEWRALPWALGGA